jgi:hypothetical protein
VTAESSLREGEWVEDILAERSMGLYSRPLFSSKETIGLIGVSDEVPGPEGGMNGYCLEAGTDSSQMHRIVGSVERDSYSLKSMDDEKDRNHPRMRYCRNERTETTRILYRHECILWENKIMIPTLTRVI